MGSPGIVATDHLLPVLPPSPQVCAPLGAQAAPARFPHSRYLVESDCIQGKGALGVQAAAAMRSGKEQEEQKGKQWGERSGAGNAGSHNAGIWQ